MLTTLKNDKLTVTAESCGAELQSIVSAEGISYLWDGHAPYWGRRSPTLFPTIGALRNGFAASCGGDIRLPKHGFCRSAPFETANANDTSVTYVYTDTPDTRKIYPYSFCFSVTHTLEDASVRTTYTVENTGDTEMPYCVGGHPAFHVPLIKGEQFTDYVVEFEERETADCPLVDMNTSLVDDRIRNRLLSNEKSFRLNHILFRGDALIFDQLRSNGAKLYSAVSGHGVYMNFADFDTFAVWTLVDDQPFVCFEPWQGGATRKSEDDVFEHKHGVVIAKPGESRSFSYTVTVF